MRRDAKKAHTYRFNGNPYLNAGSIRSVTIADLEARIRELQAKLADPMDTDEKTWTQGWLDRCSAELAKKLDGLSLKTEEQAQSKARPRSRRGDQTPES